MPIRITTGTGGIIQLKASFRKNWCHYLQEALGLAVFMISACFFGAILEGNGALLHSTIQSSFLRTLVMGVLMGTTAIFIFYSPWTSPSGAHINPAVTLTFLRLGKMCHWDAIFYILFQFAGGIAAVYTMQWLMGPVLTCMPVNSVATVPGKNGLLPALVMELMIAFVTMSMVLFTSAHPVLQKYTRQIAACLVCTWVVIAGPVSGFGMNPARSLASAIPAHTYTACWIYLLIPVTGMMGAAEFFLQCNKLKSPALKQQH